jgi:hypothetical protein
MIRVFGLVLLAAFIAESADACTVPNGSELANQTTAGRMTVKTGKPCGVRLIFSRGPTHSVEIVQRPRNGTATVVPPHRIVYRSRSGFVGSDAFTYVRRGLDTQNNPMVRTVEFAVTVTP